MITRLARARVFALTLAAIAAFPASVLHAQEAPQEPPPQQAPRDSARAAAPTDRLARLSIAAHVGEFRPAGRSELYALLDRALAPGSRPLRPKLMGAALHLRMTSAWSLVLGTDAGGTTVASASQVQPTSGVSDLRQQTTLEITSMQSLGVEWQALRWRGAGATDHLRLVLGGGGGLAHYRLQQWGNFVDVPQRIGFADDFQSTGRGAFAYASAGLEVPVRSELTLRGELRRQAGSAPMSDDYSTFDRLDLGGTTLSMGVRIPLSSGAGRP